MKYTRHCYKLRIPENPKSRIEIPRMWVAGRENMLP